MSLIPKKLFPFDIETDGLNSTKIWVMGLAEIANNKVTRSWSIFDYDEMREFLADPEMALIVHNGWSFDKPELERVLDIKIKATIVDTLGLSWYLEPKRQKHGLAAYGEEFGVPKPEIEDWEGLTIEEYDNRVTEDVKIQTKLWQRQWKHLMLLYKDEEKAWKAIRYISNKMRALSIAQKSRWKLKVKEAEKLLEFFQKKFNEAEDALEALMPQVPVYGKKSRPKKPFKGDGTLSVHGFKWAAFCEEHGVDFDSMDEHKYQTGWADPNAGSHKQLKDWLYSLGWVPETFDYKRDNDTREVRKIPQIKKEDELCPSIVRLISKEPALKYLEEMSVVKHRISVVSGFLKNADSQGFIVAGAQGFTNTLRLKHKTALNIPSVRKPYGKEIRGLLIARNDTYELLGSDMSSLEDRTKQHFMWPYDPEYVKEMQKPDFDPHCDMALEAELMTPEEVEEYKDENTGHDRKAVLSLIRHAGKSTNYAATYGATGPTIARSAGVPERVGDRLHEAYWSRNWSLKAIADDCLVKESRGMKWLWNPVAEIWYYLKTDKDRFSTLNQGTGSYLFDCWVEYILDRRPQINGQFHDEIILEVKKGNREAATKLLKQAVAYVNKSHKLNRELDVDVDFGGSYAEIH